MANTGFNTTKVAHKMAVGYNADGTVADLVNIGWSAPAGQMYSSVRDLLNLTNTLSSYQDGFLSQASQGELQAPVFFNGDGQTLFGTPWEARFTSGNSRTFPHRIFIFSYSSSTTLVNPSFRSFGSPQGRKHRRLCGSCGDGARIASLHRNLVERTGCFFFVVVFVCSCVE